MKRILYLNVCDFLFSIEFAETENVVIQNEWINQVEKHWKELIVDRDNNKVDFEIKLVGMGDEEELLVRRKDGDYFRMVGRNKDKNVVELSYFAGLFHLVFIIRDALLVLLKGEGMLFHAASSLNKDGELFVFSARPGDGKSTTGKMLEKRGWIHFTDDILVVRKIGNSFVFYSTPYMEKEYGIKIEIYNKKPRIFFVHKNQKEVKVKKIVGSVEKIKKLMSGMLIDDEISKVEIEFLGKFSDSFDCYDLYRNLSSGKLVEVLNEVK